MIISDTCVNFVYKVSESQLKHAVIFLPFLFFPPSDDLP